MDQQTMDRPNSFRLVMSAQMVNTLDQIYRNNPYPSRNDYLLITKDIDIDPTRLRNWFNNRRRRDYKKGRICRRCRYFKAPIDEETHIQEASQRPCVRYWSMPTVAAVPVAPELPSNGSSSSNESDVHHLDEVTVDGGACPTPDSFVQPGISIAVQTTSIQQPVVNIEQNSWQAHQSSNGVYPIDMCASSAGWMMRHPGPSPYWPLPFNFSRTPDLQQMPLDCQFNERRQTFYHVSATNYPTPQDIYNQYFKPEADHCNYFDEGASNYHP